MLRVRHLWLIFLSAGLLLSLPLAAQEAPYRDASLPTEERVEDLLSRMSLEEKIGQMTLLEKNSIQPEQVTEMFIGGILSGGGGYPTPNTPEAWAAMVRSYQDAALATPLGIPIITVSMPFTVITMSKARSSSHTISVWGLHGILSWWLTLAAEVSSRSMAMSSASRRKGLFSARTFREP
ncbi:hypothetical protein HC776_03735, partial [bacterium]|nr:hypothetical protein [bacterium]